MSHKTPFGAFFTRNFICSKETMSNLSSALLLLAQRLRSYAFALLTRRDYSKAELIEKLARYAQNIEEVKQLVEELSEQNYQSDQRVAEQMLASQIRKGKGPKRIQQALKTKQIENDLIADEIQEIDWVEQAYQLKVKNLEKL